MTKKKITIGGLNYKSFTIVIYNRNGMFSTTELNYDHKALATVINYDCKCDTQFGASICGLYYNHVTIVNDDSGFVSM